MHVETLKTGFTYVIALVVLIGAGVLLVIPTEVDKDSLLPFLTAVVGAVIAYVFAREQTQIVQSGNGLERAHLVSLDRKVDAIALATSPPQAPGPLVADRVDVTGDSVEVHS